MSGLQADFYDDGVTRIDGAEATPQANKVYFIVEFGNGEMGEMTIGYTLSTRDGQPCLRLPRGENTVSLPVVNEDGATGQHTQSIPWPDVPQIVQEAARQALQTDDVAQTHGLTEVRFYWGE